MAWGAACPILRGLLIPFLRNSSYAIKGVEAHPELNRGRWDTVLLESQASDIRGLSCKILIFIFIKLMHALKIKYVL